MKLVPILNSLFLHLDESLLIECGLEKEDTKEVPKYLKEFVEKHIKEWVSSAFYALNRYNEDQHYIIKSDENDQRYIEIVDSENTGVLQESMVLNNGLHQFLQLKHDLGLNSETLVSSLVSNVKFFKNYGKNLIGLTGTLGSKKEISTLKDIYGIQICFVPTFKVKRLIEYPFLLKRDENSWCTSIIESAYNEYKNGRVVLIINLHIQTVEYLRQIISQNHRDAVNDIITYQRNDIKQTISDDIISIPKIIISTNLAGRGTDIEISDEIDKRGGMHVILTFMPKNIRVQQQAFGRAARKGQKGTCQLIANEKDLENEYGKSINGDYFKIRDYSEEKFQNELKMDYKIFTSVKDEIFSKFWEFINNPKFEKDLCLKNSFEEQFSLYLYNLEEKLQEESKQN